jgi:hypothetical protein
LEKKNLLKTGEKDHQREIGDFLIKNKLFQQKRKRKLLKI